MQAYLQGPNGEELELSVTEPEPADGTYCVGLENVFDRIDGTVDLEECWIRIVPPYDIDDREEQFEAYARGATDEV